MLAAFTLGTVLITLLAVTLYSLERVLPKLLARRLAKADQLIVNKSQRRLSLLRDGHAYQVFPVRFGAQPLGPKEQEGDQKTPEGAYCLDYRNPQSRFYKAIHISYPNEQDQQRALERGVSPGGLIMIHGQRNGRGVLSWYYQRRDWTQGCIALSNRHMEELWHAVDDGTPIVIEP